jgi:hypothetical protein
MIGLTFPSSIALSYDHSHSYSLSIDYSIYSILRFYLKTIFHVLPLVMIVISLESRVEFKIFVYRF